jgi:hypothetical protein
MRKLIIVLIVTAVAYGATTVTLQIPDQYVPRVLAAFNAQKNAHINITITGWSPSEYQASWDYSVIVEPNETQGQFAKRFVAEAIKAFVKAHEQKLLKDAKAAYDANAPSVDPNVPSDIIQ